MNAKPIIGVVVPALEDAGGVQAVAAFVLRAIRASDRYDVRLVSLASASRDPGHLSLLNPASWARGPTTASGVFEGEPFLRVGAVFGEIEHQRLQPRASLARALEGCDLIQVIAGTPCWAHSVLSLGKPVALQVATLTRVERRWRASQLGGPPTKGPLDVWRRAMTALSARLDERVLRRVDAVLVENPWMLDHATAAATARTLIRYAPPGVDIDYFHPPAPSAPQPSEPPYILAVGRFSDPRKNPDLLLRAYLRLKARKPDAPRLIMAGADGPDLAFWDKVEQAGAAGDIQFIENPTREALASLYRHADIFVLPSDEEGFGMVVVEAMASGAPVIATRCGGPEGIITDGVDGFLVDRDDDAAMADRMEALCSRAGARIAMGAMARRTAATRYAEAVAGLPFVEVYDALLGRKP